MSDHETPETAGAMAAAVRRGETAPTALVEAALARIDRIAPLNAFTLVDADGARAAARALEREPPADPADLPLYGVPIAIKDFTPTKGQLTTRGSWSVGDWVPDADPVIVQRLKRAGAIIVGKTTTPEFAYSSFTQSPRWGVTRNPFDPTRTPGGSSGGAGVAVATGCTPLAEGTDMGGSVRIPAALCGVVGLKPSLGRIPMDILPTGPDILSHFGPLAACVDDAGLFLAATQGPDGADILSQPAPGPIPHPIPEAAPGRRIALTPDLGFYAVDPGVAARVEQTAEALRGAGHSVETVDLGWTRASVDSWTTLWGVALYAAFGDALATHRERMDPTLVALMEAGRLVGAAEARRVEAIRHRLWADLDALFARFDALILPTCARPAPPVDKRDADYETDAQNGRYAGLDMCSPFNLVSACPALSVPIGTVEGLPVGLQIVGPRFDDLSVLRLAKTVERLHPPRRAPPPT